MILQSYSASAVTLANSTARFTALKDDVGQISNQLSTGKLSTNYAGLGAGAGTSVSLHFKLTGLEDTEASIDAGSLKLSLMDTSLTQIAKIANDLPTSVSKIRNNPSSVMTSSTVSAEQGLDIVVQALNEQLDGRYLFAGRTSDTKPVASTDQILNGDGPRAGLVALITQRQAADAGSNGLGRVTLSGAGTPLVLSEDAASLPFGLKLQAASSTGTGVTATRGGSPAAVSITVNAQPAAGDQLTVTVGLPDGTTSQIKLVAGSVGGTDAISYDVGATTAATTENIRTALGTAIGTLASTVLPAASAMLTSKRFFAADANNPPPRVAGPPYESATSETAGTAADTVVWYSGEVTNSPRSSSLVRVSDGQSVGIGAAANESGFQQVLTSLGALAASDFTGTSTLTRSQFGALADRVSANLGTAAARQSVGSVSDDLALAATTMKNAKATGTITQAQIKDALAGIEDADPTEAATRLLATQTRLQASYQTTATIMKMSLVNYL